MMGKCTVKFTKFELICEIGKHLTDKVGLLGVYGHVEQKSRRVKSQINGSRDMAIFRKP